MLSALHPGSFSSDATACNYQNSPWTLVTKYYGCFLIVGPAKRWLRQTDDVMGPWFKLTRWRSSPKPETHRSHPYQWSLLPHLHRLPLSASLRTAMSRPQYPLWTLQLRKPTRPRHAVHPPLPAPWDPTLSNCNMSPLPNSPARVMSPQQRRVSTSQAPPHLSTCFPTMVRSWNDSRRWSRTRTSGWSARRPCEGKRQRPWPFWGNGNWNEMVDRL